MVRRAGGPVVDANGAGRGAYVHPDAACIAALSEATLVRALRGGVSEADVGRLEADLRSRLGAG
ncbi:MAG: YlxR family protein [Actinomycetota bacterium]|nr:YlxR family protein [Actinomycetota bacterium]